jgi:serine/threonine-protein kinase
MADVTSNGGAQDQLLGEAVYDCLLAVEAGRSPADVLARYPQFAADLADFLANRARVERLAAGLREATSGTPPAGADPTAETAAAAHPPGPHGLPFGDYELLEELGRGGMGVVYRARQTSLGREVALKVMRPGDGGAEARRLRNEAETAAGLDHPNIVPVYEVGEHGGQPFFSMKLVAGGSLAAARKDARDAARLVATVARAVHYAHQRGVLHRDLKPANILLDERGEPHVTDFGLARRAEADSSLTQSGAPVGTPAYMAPEQAAGRRDAITTATDVHGLGAVLYALLTGRPPFRAETLLETLEQVKGREPEPPRASNPKVDRDLETVCLKCLQKEPGQRYPSALALAEDLERWLRGEPIQARPVGPAARLWRWCRRQPVPAALAAALLLAVAAGIALVVWQWRRAEDNLVEADDLRREAVAREAEVEAGFRLAHDAVKDLSGFGRQGLLEAHGLEPLQRELLLKARAYYRTFLEQRGHDPALRYESAEASAWVADLTRRIGAPAEALDAYRRALAQYDELARQEPDSIPLRRQRAKLHNHIGAVLDALGRRGEALDEVRRARALLDEGLRKWPGDPRLEDELAITYHNLAVNQAAKEPAAALASYKLARGLSERLLRARPNDPDLQARLANTLNNVGILLMTQGRLADALDPLREAVALRDRLARRFPDNPAWQAALAQSLCDVGDCLRGRGLHEEGMENLRKARGILERLAVVSPHVTLYRLRLGLCQLGIGVVCLADGDAAEALAALRQARAVLQQLAGEHPNVPEYQARLEQVHLNIAQAHSRLGEHEPALRAYDAARDVVTRLAAAAPGDPDLASRLARTWHRRAVPLANMGRLEDARLSLLRAVAQQRRALDAAPGSIEYRRKLTGHYAFLAHVERDLGRADEAVATTAKRMELWPDDAGVLYAAARDLALTGAAPKTAPAARPRCADLAVRALRLAVKAGFRNGERARTDPALASLRGRDDFRQLLTAMSQGPGP